MRNFKQIATFILIIIVYLFFEKKFIYAAETANFKIQRTGESITDGTTSGSTWTFYKFTYNSSTFQLKDNNQNSATISQINKLKMTQDDDYYYFDVDINYKSENTLWDGAINVGGGQYQSIRNGDLYLSNVSNSNIEYEHNKSNYGYYQERNNGGTTSNQEGSITNTEDLKLSVNGKTIKQSATWGNSTTTTGDLVNAPSSSYCTYNFPFYNYINYPNNTNIYNNDEMKYFNTSFLNTFEYKTMDFYGTLSINYIRSERNPMIHNALHSCLWINSLNYVYPQKSNNTTIEINSINKNTSVNYWNNDIKAKIKIKKDEINNYRYLNMYAPSAVLTSYSNNLNYTAKSVHSENAIDLLPLTNCEHNWVFQYNANKNEHEVYCSKCEWSHYEPHNLEFEYDGIRNNACKCGYIDKVHYSYEINDDTNETITETLESYNNYQKSIVPNKHGFKFKWYEKYEKRFKDEYNTEFSTTNTELRTVFIATSSTITDNTGGYSMIYKAVYEPNQYMFKFSNENIKGLTLNGHLEDQVFYYGTSQPIKNHIIYENFGFKGWSLKATSSEIDFAPNQEILNYTDIDNKIFTLYPVYDVLKYKIVYSTVPCRFSNALKVMTKEYSIFDNVELEMPILEDEVYSESDGATVTTTYKFGSYTDNDKKEIKSMNEVKNLAREKGIYNYTIYLNANYLKSVTKKGGKNSGGGGSGGSGSGYIKSIKTEPAIPINGETIVRPGDIYVSTSGNSIDIIVMDTPPEKPINNRKEYKQYSTNAKNYNNTSISKEAKEVIEEKFEPEVAEYILENEDAYKEVEEVINEELGVQGMSMSPQEEFYNKYGVYIATTSYLVNYHLYNIKKATKQQKILGFIGDHKLLFIPLFLLIIAGAGFYYYKMFWNRSEEKPKKRRKKGE